jgi:hypothetical protein
MKRSRPRSSLSWRRASSHGRGRGGAGGGTHQAFALPLNAATGKAYSGINILILWGRLFESGYALSLSTLFEANPPIS